MAEHAHAGPAEAPGAGGRRPGVEWPGREEPAAEGLGVEGLGVKEEGVLAMERRRWRHQGAKEQAVRDELGLSAARYHQVLNALLDDPRALAADPVLVGRLRRLREARTDHLPS